jgi:hypothetical protein
VSLHTAALSFRTQIALARPDFYIFPYLNR